MSETTYMKDAFVAWMRGIKNRNGNQYSDETISNYVTSLSTHVSKLEDPDLKITDLFTIDTLQTFIAVRQKITASPNYNSVNTAYHRILSSALSMYGSFLETQSGAGGGNEFASWLKERYSVRTAQHYITALKKIDSWLGIELSRSVMTITNLKEFDGVKEQIMNHPDFGKVNQSSGGHNDVSAALNAYRKYLVESSTNNWWPALSEYDPGITKEQWLELLNNPAVSGKDPTWVMMMAMYYMAKDGATCTQAGKRFGFSGQSVRASCTQFAIWVQNNTGCPTAKKEDGKDSYWPILFQGRDAKKEEDGVYVWRMRPELYDACTEFGILRFLPKEGAEPTVSDIRTNMSPQEALPRIKEYIAAKGFSYPEGLIENYWLSLKSKPFVILAGTSGTGKTRLVRLFAEAIGAGYHLVSVRPDWSDGSDLFGHTDLNGTFHPGPVCAAFDEAIKEPDKPVFLCLDEMNLARVEYYLSDFLSVIESRRKAGDRVSTDGIAQYGEGIPDNLYVVGTVNMDETTFPFSKKVLDRANTIEFSYVDLTPDFEAARGQAEALALSNSFLRTEYLVLTADCAEEESFVKKVCGELQEINGILKKANAHVGYRVRDEIVFYLLNNEKAGKLLKYEQAMDNEIMQKILPRIQGSSMAVKTLLMDLFKFCMGSGGGLDADSGNVGEQMKNAAESARYPESAQKIGYMMTRFEDDGFTSYWL